MASTTLPTPVRAIPAGSTEEAERRVSRAISSLVMSEPFFATLLLGLKREVNLTIPTMRTNGTRIQYNPSFVMQLTHEELKAVWCHEVLHVVSMHPWRGRGKQRRKWNVAVDAVVNAVLDGHPGLKLPTSWKNLKGQTCTPVPGIPDLSAEEIYATLPDMDEEGDGEGGEGEGYGDEGLGDVFEPTGEDGRSLSEADRQAQMDQARVNIKQAVQAAVRAGKLPLGLRRLAEDMSEPQVPWQELLAQFVDGHARTDYSWSRPSMRYFAQDLILPSLWSEAYGEIILGCDTSGSMDDATLKDVAGEVLGALDAYATAGQTMDLTVAWFDHDVYPQTITDVDEIDIKGGGGTSFAVVFDWLTRREEVLPKACVMVTDGYCSDYGQDPGIPVLWVLTATNAGFSPKFGQVICTMHKH